MAQHSTFVAERSGTFAPAELWKPERATAPGASDLRQLPPPPEPSMPKIRQAIRFMRDPFALLSAVRAECGDLFALRVPGRGKVVFLCSADLLNEVYKMPEDRVVAGEIRKKMVGYLTGSQASLSIDGETYAYRRRVMAPYFSGNGLSRQTGHIAQVAAEMIGAWPLNRPFRLQPFLHQASCRIICRVLYGSVEREREDHLLRLSLRFLTSFRSAGVHMPFLQWNLGGFTPWGRFLAARRDIREALEHEIRERGAEPPREDGGLLSGLLAAGLDEDPAQEREIVLQELLSMLVGGAETTATVLAWTLTGLLTNAEARARLRAELDAVLGERAIDADDLRRLPYLDAVIQEGMRHQSVAPFAGPRLAKKDFDLGGFRIPAGSVLVQCLSEVGRGEVFPNPHRFDPGNFFGRDVKTRDWVPFGGGSRTCTGMGLARLELAVIVATVMQRADLELAGGSLRPVRRGMVFLPEDGLRVRRLPGRPG